VPYIIKADRSVDIQHDIQRQRMFANLKRSSKSPGFMWPNTG